MTELKHTGTDVPARAMSFAGPLALLAGLLVAAVVLGWLGLNWRGTVPLTTIVIEGNTHVPSATLHERLALAGDTMLFDIRPADVVERLMADPWVATATVRRRPSGTLHVRVTEREPVVLLIRGGAPSMYLDRYGSSMPLSSGKPADVPILSGAAAPVVAKVGDAVSDQGVQELLSVIAGLDDIAFDRISEVAMTRNGIALFTTPLPGGSSIRVNLGSGEFGEKLRRLEGFWSQVVLTRPQQAISEIDLRFEGQIITS